MLQLHQPPLNIYQNSRRHFAVNYRVLHPQHQEDLRVRIYTMHPLVISTERLHVLLYECNPMVTVSGTRIGGTGPQLKRVYEAILHFAVYTPPNYIDATTGAPLP
eukprot:TRINITY_DN56122_c0_g1_i1.p1 TRINITY_DN56122_c0_g1~~TRINITY_DN56122_c0_g1_i1.p1  ORF type:complete len:105 (+),score=16.32 TRINITY_DN56122_c0_g1_i1:60-374(+)